MVTNKPRTADDGTDLPVLILLAGRIRDRSTNPETAELARLLGEVCLHIIDLEGEIEELENKLPDET